MSDLDATLRFDGPLYIEEDTEPAAETAPAAQETDQPAS